MRYALLLHYPEVAEELSPEAMAEGMKAFDLYAKQLTEAGVLQSAEVLAPSPSSTTITAIDGKLRIQDGPFADTKEQLGGTFVIEVADLDAAIEWASKAPSVAWGAAELRPVGMHVVDGTWV
ncbi:MAG: YciI family protein [Pseudolysinimonas sp.]